MNTNIDRSVEESNKLFELAKKVIPGGVNSPVRAFKSVGGNPIFIDKAKGAYLYEHPKTGEVSTYSRKGIYKKDGEILIYKGKASEYQGRKVKLNKPFRTPDGPKKFSVYVKNEKGNVVKVNFGDPNMEIKRDNPARRKSFRARHKCDTNPGPKWKARYWSCKMW